jgi:hypothetical protein
MWAHKIKSYASFPAVGPALKAGSYKVHHGEKTIPKHAKSVYIFLDGYEKFKNIPIEQTKVRGVDVDSR